MTGCGSTVTRELVRIVADSVYCTLGLWRPAGGSFSLIWESRGSALTPEEPDQSRCGRLFTDVYPDPAEWPPERAMRQSAEQNVYATADTCRTFTLDAFARSGLPSREVRRRWQTVPVCAAKEGTPGAVLSVVSNRTAYHALPAVRAALSEAGQTFPPEVAARLCQHSEPSQQLAAALFGNHLHILILWEPSHPCRVLWCNPFFQLFLDNQLAPVVGQPLQRLYPAGDAAAAQDLLETVAETGQPMYIDDFAYRSPGLGRKYGLPDDTTYWRARFVPVLDAGGRCIAVFEVCQERTAEKLNLEGYIPNVLGLLPADFGVAGASVRQND